MQYLSERVRSMEESATLAMAAKARELKAQGQNIISLSLGEPDFATPKHIQEAAIAAIQEQKWFAYPPVAGYADLRQALAKKLREENGIECGPENIVVSGGAKQSIANVMLSLLDEGDEVIVFSPYWVSYAEIIKMAGGVPVFIHAGVERGFKAAAWQLREALSPKTKAVIFSSPCNPTGAVFSEPELKAIAGVIAETENVFIIADEIYEHINYTGHHASIGSFPEVKDKTITVNGFSKGFAMTGWRVGYICAPLAIAKACEKIQGQITSGISTISQRAALAAITGDLGPTKEMGKIYEKRKELILGLLAEIPGIRMNNPDGAFYAFPDISSYFGKSANGATINNAGDLALYILSEAKVSVVTGEAFGAPECIRLSFAASESDITEALHRIKQALAKLS